MGVMNPWPCRSRGMNSRSKRARIMTLTSTAAVGVCGIAWATGLFGSSDSVGPAPASAASLEPFASCEDVLDHVRKHRWAIGAYPYGPLPAVAEDATVLRAADSAAGAAADAVGPSQSGTNVQEAGIDEPDLAKLDGETLYVAERRMLRSYDVSGEDPDLLAELGIERGDTEPQLLINGDRAFVLATTSSRPDYRPATRITEVDISDPAALIKLRTAVIEGGYVDARLRGDTAHLVISSQPDYPGDGSSDGPVPEPPGGATGETGPDPDGPGAPTWLPTVTITDEETGASTTDPLFDCDAIAYPKRFAGLGLISVLTIDAEQGLPAIDADTVMTNGTTVYASAESLYVATETIAAPGGGVIESLGRAIVPDVGPAPRFPGETAIHRFDVSDDEETRYAASGEVAGRILNEWSLSEHEGVLRVAATEGDPWAGGPNESETAVTVLAERDGELSRIGRAGGLGRGETIFGVRFIGESGYVVTFEQTDPLYTVDLSDPRQPEVTGELKIPGYSAYLHPVGDQRILGIGQAGTNDGRLTGAQASLFDVGDPGQPERIDTLGLLDDRFGSAEAEWDSHAFLFWPAERLAVVPVTSYGRGAQASAVAFRVGSDGSLAKVAELADSSGQIRRMLVAEGRLLTVSDGGVTSRSLAGLG